MLSSFEKHTKETKTLYRCTGNRKCTTIYFFFLKENKLFVLKAENSPHIIDALMDYFKLNTIGGIS